MSHPPLVSVVIPNYNYGQYLEDAVNSALLSTYKHIEVIVVDDASTDLNTLEVLKRLEQKDKTIVLYHEANKGLPATRNTGIQAANGKYIMPLDADDMIASTLIEKGVRVLEKYPKVGFLSTGVRAFGEASWSYIPPRFNFYTLLFDNIVVDSLFRKSAWQDAGGYNEKMVMGYEDWDFWIAVAKRGWKCRRIPEKLYYYRKHGKSFIDEAKAKHEMLIKQIRSNHPELYNPRKLKQLKRRWNMIKKRKLLPNRKKRIATNRSNRKRLKG